MLFTLLLRVAALAPVAILRPLGTETEPGRTSVCCLCMGAGWAYAAVLANVLCPISSCTVFKSTAPITSRPLQGVPERVRGDVFDLRLTEGENSIAVLKKQ
jgi:hypothetical protein